MLHDDYFPSIVRLAGCWWGVISPAGFLPLGYTLHFTRACKHVFLVWFLNVFCPPTRWCEQHFAVLCISCPICFFVRRHGGAKII